MARFKRVFSFICVGLALLFCSPLGMGLLYGLQTWPLPSFLKPLFSHGAVLQMMGWGAGLLAFPLALVCAVLGILPRRQWLFYTFCSLWMWSFPLVSFRSFRPMRRAGLEKSVLRLQVVPSALERFRRATGVYPAQLSQLAPQYLAQLPPTGMVAYPKLHYRCDAQNGLPSYEIQVHTPVGFMGFDALFYRPDGYDFLGNSEVERIGAWAYLHE